MSTTPEPIDVAEKESLERIESLEQELAPLRKDTVALRAKVLEFEEKHKLLSTLTKIEESA